MTKILATISRIDMSEDKIKKLIEAGANGFRFNTAHQGFDESLDLIKMIRNVSPKTPIIIDTKGPEIRTTINKDNAVFQFKTGDKVKIYCDPAKETTKEAISLNYANYMNEIPEPCLMLIDDGEIAIQIEKKENDCMLGTVQNDGELASRKSVNTPGVRLNLPSLSEKDKSYVQFAIENNIDYIAHSFIRDKHDVLDLKKILEKSNSKIGIISKIENQEGVDNIDEIIDVSDGIMVARGDLGIEVPLEKIPFIQKEIIRKSRAKRKFVITATQMLHTMIKNPRPTRAEVSDIANAIYDGTDSLMLSGETAYGKYPLEAVSTMSKIAAETEKHITKRVFLEDVRTPDKQDTLRTMAEMVVSASFDLPMKCIVADTHSGNTLREISVLRPQVPIYVVCYEEETMRKVALNYGCECFYFKDIINSTLLINFLKELLNMKKVTEKDMVGILKGKYGIKFGVSSIMLDHIYNLVN